MVEPGDVGATVLDGDVKRVVLDTGSQRSLSMLLSDGTKQTVTMVVTRGAPSFRDTEELRGTREGHRVKVQNDSGNEYRFAVTSSLLGLVTMNGVDVAAGATAESRIFKDEVITRVDLADVDANAGYRIYFTVGLDQDVEFVVSDSPSIPP
jgi:hypothetical protein